MPPENSNVAARRWTLPTVLGILVVGAALTAGALRACFGLRPDETPPLAGGGGSAPSSAALPDDLFRGWPAGKKPDVVFILSGQQHSFLKFCGCSRPQLGGFERRYNFMAKLRERGWPLVAADLGDLVQYNSGIHDQALLKYEIAMKALNILGYSAIGVGSDDFALPLIDGMSLFTLQKPDAPPRILAANLDRKYRADVYPNPEKPNQSMIGDWVAARPAGGPAVGIVGLIGGTVMKQIQAKDAKVQFADNNATVLAAALKEMEAAHVELKVVLFQGTFAHAQAIAQQHFPDKFNVILCLSDEDTPPARADQVGKTMIVRVGHRGRYLGVVGAYHTGKPGSPFDLYYQSVQLGEVYETDKAKEKDHPIIKLLDHYADEVKSQDFLKRTPQRAVPVPQALAGLALHYVGSDACKSCHQAEFATWKTSKHAHAIDALVKVANKPDKRQFDPECISCHVVGYGLKSGYDGKPATTHLAHVGCESCHGPGSAHASAANNPAFRAAMSPWKSNPRDYLPAPGTLQKGVDAMTPAEKAIYLHVVDVCIKCHDTDNDPHFEFAKNWPQIIHGKNAKATAPPPGAAAQTRP